MDTLKNYFECMFICPYTIKNWPFFEKKNFTSQTRSSGHPTNIYYVKHHKCYRRVLTNIIYTNTILSGLKATSSSNLKVTILMKTNIYINHLALSTLHLWIFGSLSQVTQVCGIFSALYINDNQSQICGIIAKFSHFCHSKKDGIPQIWLKSYEM